MQQKEIFKQSLTDFNSEFSFSYTGYYIIVKELSPPNYLPMQGKRIIGFISSLRVLALCEMHAASSRIWTQIIISIS